MGSIIVRHSIHNGVICLQCMHGLSLSQHSAYVASGILIPYSGYFLWGGGGGGEIFVDAKISWSSPLTYKPHPDFEILFEFRLPIDIVHGKLELSRAHTPQADLQRSRY